MSNYNHKKSKLTGSLWLGLAVFFVVFCSCPVKRYIRLHLYNQKFSIENTNGDHFSINDIKDCSIADRHHQSEITVLKVLQRPADDHNEHTVFLIPTLLPGIAFSIFKRDEDRYGNSLHNGAGVPIPLYLWIRHLQV